MQFDSNLSATLVFDGLDSPSVPLRMGLPASGQLQGTPLECLAELAGRVCYDSLGRGRSSKEYHRHILEVGHLSVYEHCLITVEFRHTHSADLAFRMCQEIVMLCVNRPGVWLERHGSAVRITLNMRALLEWDQWIPRMPVHGSFAQSIRAHLFQIASSVMPAVFSSDRVPEDETRDLVRGMVVTCVEPLTEDERWVTMLLTGSRGFSHELVRHGDFTAISQRSTRYVDESETPWVRHPVLTHIVDHNTLAIRNEPQLLDESGLFLHEKEARAKYADLVARIQMYLLEDVGGIDKHSARKQARGAARGYLGNALYTEVVFSASLAQWKRILRQRLAVAADAEIRAVFELALDRLKQTRYGACFGGFDLGNSPDGIGRVLEEARVSAGSIR